MTQERGWRATDLPELRGRIALVTGASSGIGLATARQLARSGARTLLACRDRGRAQQARQLILNQFPSAAVEIVLLDLASLESVEDAAEEIADLTGHLDLLVNNAGVMAVKPGLTADGYELQIGTNHLGHFALTGRLLPLLLAGTDSRVVTVTSLAHHGAPAAGLVEPDQFRTLPGNSRWLGYCRSKLANVLFALELDRRWKGFAALGPGDEGHSRMRSLAAHPGVARSELMDKASAGRRRVFGPIARLGMDSIAQSSADGALPTLYAASRPELDGGELIGPRGLHGLHGTPGPCTPGRIARKEDLAARLWAASIAATGVGFEELQARITAS
jgi:NAD(P)-dependent dehydrogenase (short-subunit alcohol dehydrogenase family)